MPSPDIFGSLISTYQVEQAVLGTLNPWMDTYLSEVETRHGLTPGTLARPRSSQSSYDFQNWAEGQLPALVVVCAGTTGDAERQDGGRYAAWFDVEAGVLVEDTTERNARMVASLHQSAIDGILVQRGSLGGFASRTRFATRSSRLPDADNRTLAYAMSAFRVLVEGIADEQLGPATVSPPVVPWQPAADFPTITETEIDITVHPNA